MKRCTGRTRRNERRTRRAASAEVTGTSKGISIDVERTTALGTMLGVHTKRHELLVGTALTLMAAVVGEAAFARGPGQALARTPGDPREGLTPRAPARGARASGKHGRYSVYAIACDFGAAAAREWLGHVATQVPIDPELVRRMGDVVSKAGGPCRHLGARRIRTERGRRGSTRAHRRIAPQLPYVEYRIEA